MRSLHLTSFEQDAATLVHVLRDAPDAPVPSCPGWTLRDLGAHVGKVHRWAGAALGGQHAPDEEASVPDHADVATWVEQGAAGLHALLVATDPDAPRWGLGRPPQTAAFWVRRQAHETSLHRWDAEVAAGRAAALDPVLSLDGVAEVADVLYPRQVRLGRREPLGSVVELVTPQGRVLLGEGAPVGRVHGPAEALLLVVWGRRRAVDLVADGTLTADHDAAISVLDQQLVP